MKKNKEMHPTGNHLATRVMKTMKCVGSDDPSKNSGYYIALNIDKQACRTLLPQKSLWIIGYGSNDDDGEKQKIGNL